jgi:D-hydroxyproline dehydrogenase subunit alpha
VRLGLAAGGASDPAAREGAGLASSPERRLARVQRRAARERRFGAVLARLWPVPGGWWERVEPATTVCRCEEVAWSAVADAVADGAHDLRAVKGRTRAGMGLCQGRVCGPPLQLAVAGLTGRPIDQVGDLASRPIAVPVTLARLARLVPAGSEPSIGDPA